MVDDSKDSGAGNTSDVYEITRLVTPVVAASPLIPAIPSLAGYTNGKSYFFTGEQVESIAEALTLGEIRRRAGGGWEEVIPGKGLRVLAERHIDGQVFYRFRKHWEFSPIAD